MSFEATSPQIYSCLLLLSSESLFQILGTQIVFSLGCGISPYLLRKQSHGVVRVTAWTHSQSPHIMAEILQLYKDAYREPKEQMLRAGLHCGPAKRLSFSLFKLSTSLEWSMRRGLEDIQPLKRIVAPSVAAIDQSLWRLEKASNFSTSDDGLFPSVRTTPLERAWW